MRCGNDSRPSGKARRDNYSLRLSIAKSHVIARPHSSSFPFSHLPSHTWCPADSHPGTKWTPSVRRQAFARDYHVRLVTLSPNYGPVRTMPESPMTSRGLAAFIMRNKARKGGALGAQEGNGARVLPSSTANT